MVIVHKNTHMHTSIHDHTHTETHSLFACVDFVETTRMKREQMNSLLDHILIVRAISSNRYQCFQYLLSYVNSEGRTLIRLLVVI